MLIRKKKKNYERLTPVSVDTQESDVISLSGKHLGTMENGEFKLEQEYAQNHQDHTSNFETDNLHELLNHLGL